MSQIRSAAAFWLSALTVSFSVSAAEIAPAFKPAAPAGRTLNANPGIRNALDPTRLAADAPPPADLVKFAGLSPEDAAKEATLPPGFKMHLFAGEPDVRQPVAFTIDERGRLWVAEGMTYPRRRGQPPVEAPPAGADPQKPTPQQLKDIFGGADRLLVFEDSDGDHKFDKRTVFAEGLNLVSGLEIGFGGVWIGAAPYLMFIPIADGDAPKPAGEPRILLDGWDYKADSHEVLNTFIWGPDGWLYGCHGVFCPSFVGQPGTSAADRQRVDAAVWRYHPVQQRFEVFAEGTSNPWGVDFDENGQCIIEACVIPHFWHIIQGARYERQGGQHYNINLTETRAHEQYHAESKQRHINPFIYEDIKTHGDHVHYAGNKGPHAANGRSDTAGGGHAHAGVMIYQGASWPEEYRNKVFMNNIHGQRLNMDILERRGSGYVGKHGPDFVNFNDTSSQVLNMRCDQDGSVYLIDWYDRNQCHHNREDGHDRANGRIFKIVYHNQPVTKVDLGKKSDEELLDLVVSKNEWVSRTARRLMQERSASLAPLVRAYSEKASAISDTKGLENIDPKLSEAWSRMSGWAEWAGSFLNTSDDEAANLRMLWLTHITGSGLSAEYLAKAKRNDEHFRAWSLRLAFEREIPEDAVDHLRVIKSVRNFTGRDTENLWKTMLISLREAADDDSAMVRLAAASALQRTTPALRWQTLSALLSHAEDAQDHNLPLMYWYALEPCIDTDPVHVVQLMKECKIPKVREFIARRLTTLSLMTAVR